MTLNKKNCQQHTTATKMAFGLYSLIEAVILCLNAVCILHEERFLAKSKCLMNLNMAVDL